MGHGQRGEIQDTETSGGGKHEALDPLAHIGNVTNQGANWSWAPGDKKVGGSRGTQQPPPPAGVTDLEKKLAPTPPNPNTMSLVMRGRPALGGASEVRGHGLGSPRHAFAASASADTTARWATWRSALCASSSWHQAPKSKRGTVYGALIDQKDESVGKSNNILEKYYLKILCT